MRPGPEAAFSLIEVVVAMVLLGILLAAVGSAMAGANAGSLATESSRRTVEASSAAMSMIRSDLGTAAAPDRYDSRLIATSEELSVALGVAPSGVTAPAAAQTAVAHDIVSITPTALWIRTDAAPDAADGDAAECVGWYVDQTGALVREVREDWRSCASPGSIETLLPPPSEPGVQAARFSLATMTPASTPTPTGAGGGGKGNGRNSTSADRGNPNRTNPTLTTLPACARGAFTPTELSASSADRARIVAVRVELLARPGSGGQQLSQLVDLRNRLTPFYLEAIGCAT